MIRASPARETDLLALSHSPTSSSLLAAHRAHEMCPPLFPAQSRNRRVAGCVGGSGRFEGRSCPPSQNLSPRFAATDVLRPTKNRGKGRETVTGCKPLLNKPVDANLGLSETGTSYPTLRGLPTGFCTPPRLFSPPEEPGDFEKTGFPNPSFLVQRLVDLVERQAVGETAARQAADLGTTPHDAPGLLEGLPQILLVERRRQLVSLRRQGPRQIDVDRRPRRRRLLHVLRQVLGPHGAITRRHAATLDGVLQLPDVPWPGAGQ